MIPVRRPGRVWHTEVGQQHQAEARVQIQLLNSPQDGRYHESCPGTVESLDLYSLAMLLPAEPDAVRLVEVGPRDGLQNITQVVPTDLKVELIQRLASTGLTTIETTSFVSPKWIPQLADGPNVLRALDPLIRENPTKKFPVLVPNVKGLRRAIENRAREVAVFVSASEGFSRKNTNCSINEALERAHEVNREAAQRGVLVRG
jgi:hypothetical protein